MANVRPPRIRLSGQVERALDPIDRALEAVSQEIEGRVPRSTSSLIKQFVTGSTNLVQASVDSWTLFQANPSLTIKTPHDPEDGATFGVRNLSTDLITFRMNSGTDRFEDPRAIGTFRTGSITINIPGMGAEWMWSGNNPTTVGWFLISYFER